MSPASMHVAGALPWALTAASDAVAEHPDAELLRLCADYEVAEMEIVALYEPDDIDEDRTMQALGAILDRMRPVLDRMEEVRAKTPAGIHARARAMASSNPKFESSFENEGTVPCRLLTYLIRDALALGVGKMTEGEDYLLPAGPGKPFKREVGNAR